MSQQKQPQQVILIPVTVKSNWIQFLDSEEVTTKSSPTGTLMSQENQVNPIFCPLEHVKTETATTGNLIITSIVLSNIILFYKAQRVTKKSPTGKVNSYTQSVYLRKH